MSRLRPALLTLLSALLLAGLLPAFAQATGTPDISLAKTAPAKALYGTAIPITLKVTNPGPGTGYNLSFRDVLPPGVSYVAGSADPEPQVLLNSPSGTQTTLIWSNLADVAASGDYSLSFRVRPADASFEVAQPVTDAAEAFVNSDPRLVPSFNTNGTSSGNQTGSAAASASTTLTAIDIVKDGPGEMLRGVHDHPYTFTLKTTNNGVRPTKNVVVQDYLPAGLEFLGCGGVDNTTNAPTNVGGAVPADEYPGSGPIAGATIANPDCLTPTTVETVTNPAGLAPGVYTHVVWNLSADLAANGTNTITYRAAVPIRENTATFIGGTPNTTGKQIANLNNNSGKETFDEQPLINSAIAKGDYQKPGGAIPVSDQDDHTATAEDIILAKTGSSAKLEIGAITTWTLTATASEYRFIDDIRIGDVVPDGLCPLDTNNNESDTTPDCDGGAGFAPSNPYKTIGENADGTWKLTWDKSTAPQLTRIQPNGSATVTFQTRTRTNYQQNFVNAGPILANDDVLNTADVAGKDYRRCTGGPNAIPCAAPAKRIDGDEIDGEDDLDAASFGQSSTAPSINKTTAKPLADGTCPAFSSNAYDKTLRTFTPGDRICYRLEVDFPQKTSTGTRPLVDFLPSNVAYDSGVTPTNYGTQTGVFDGTDAASGVLRWTFNGAPGTVPDTGLKFISVFAGTVKSAVTYPDGQVKGNLMKFTSVNTAGRAFALRDLVDSTANIPLAIKKGVADVNDKKTDGTGGTNPANTDNLTVNGGDDVTYRVDLTNDSDKAITGGQVWDKLPPGIACAVVTNISNGGACSTVGTQDFIKWSGLSLAAGSGTPIVPVTLTLNYDVKIPTTFPPGTNLPNTAGIRTYDAATNTGGTFTFVPASNIDPAVIPGAATEPNVIRADDPSNVRIRGAAFTKTRTTSVDETGNDPATQATIGETVNYTVKAVIPKNTQFSDAPTIVDNVSAQLAIVGTPVATTDSGAAPSVVVAGQKITAALPGPYTTGANDVTLTLTFSAKVVDDTINNVRGANVPNVATFSFKDRDSATVTQTANVDTRIVEPQVSLTKKNSATGPVSPGDTITYTVNAKNGNGANVSIAHNAKLVDAVPVGVTPVDPATNAAAANGVIVSTQAGGGVWNSATRTITWNTELAVGADVDLTYKATIDNPAVAGKQLTNTVALTSTSMPGIVPGERTTGMNYEATANSTISPALATITKKIVSPPSPDKATIGQLVNYELTVKIPANEQFYDLAVRDLLPDRTALVSYGTPSCDGATCAPAITSFPDATGAEASWFIGDRSPSATERTIVLPYVARVVDTRRGSAVKTKDGDEVQNTATLYSNRTDKVQGTPGAVPPANQYDDTKSDTKKFTVAEPKLTVDKSVGGQIGDSDARTAQPDQTLTYTVLVTNTGTSTAYDAAVLDTEREAAERGREHSAARGGDRDQDLVRG